MLYLHFFKRSEDEYRQLDSQIISYNMYDSPIWSHAEVMALTSVCFPVLLINELEEEHRHRETEKVVQTSHGKESKNFSKHCTKRTQNI